MAVTASVLSHLIKETDNENTKHIKQLCFQPAISSAESWWSDIVVSALALINEVNQRRARLVLRSATVYGFNSRCQTFISVYNQPDTQGQLSCLSLRGR